MKNLYLVLAIFVICFNSGYAQLSISGYAFDEETLEPLMFATVYISNEKGDIIKGIETNVDGHYTIEDIEPGDYVLQGSYIGFENFKKNITVFDSSKAVEIPLSQGMMLTEVVILAYGICNDSCWWGCGGYSCTISNSESTALLRKKSTGIKNVLPEANIHIYPNPTTDYLIIDLKKDSGKIDIININGQVIYQKDNAIAEEHTVDVRDYPTGEYIVRLQNNEDITMEKFMIIN